MLHRTGSFAMETWIGQKACLKKKPSSCPWTQTLASHVSTHMQTRLKSLFWNIKTWRHMSHPHEDMGSADRKNMVTWIHWDSVGVCAFGMFSPFKDRLLNPELSNSESKTAWFRYAGADDVSSYWQLVLRAQTQHLNVHWLTGRTKLFMKNMIHLR